MSFDVINNFLQGRLRGLGFARSEEPFDFENAGSNEYGKTFILHPTSGQLVDNGENMNIKTYDTQVWQVKIAFSKSDINDVINRDIALRKIEAIIKDFDNPSNWLGTLRFLRYDNWEIEEMQNHFLVTIEFIVQDTITY